MSDSNRPRGVANGHEEGPAWSPPADNPYTFQGEVAGIAAFAAGISKRRGWRRRAGTAIVLMYLGCVVGMLILGAITIGSR